MTELAYLYDPIAYEAAMAKEADRLREATRGTDGIEKSADEIEAERIAELQQLALAGLSRVAPMIGHNVADQTYSIITDRHSKGHNRTLKQ